MPDWLTASFATLVAAGLLLIIAPRFETLPVVHAQVEKKIPPDVVGFVKTAMLFSGVGLVALGILGRDFSKRAKRKVPNNILLGLLLLAAPLILLQWLKPVKLFVANSSSKQLAGLILASEERGFPVYGYYYFRTSLPFYLRRPVGLVTSGAEEMTSNYVVSRWPGVQPELNRAGFDGAVPAAGLGSLPGPLVMERDWRSKTRSGAMLVFLPNHLVSNLYKSGKSPNPLRIGWGYSLWEIPARAEPRNPEQ